MPLLFRGVFWGDASEGDRNEVIVFGDDRDYQNEWKLMGETMKQVEEYTYLGLTIKAHILYGF